MIGVIILAHDEARAIGACLRAVLVAAAAPRLRWEPVRIVVVLDDCRDRTGAIANDYGVESISADARNVGIARAAGAQHLLATDARWLAFTDADTLFAPDWLVAQLAQSSDAVCGTVAVADWGDYDDAMRRHYAATYTDADGHRQIHGANLGVSAEAYRRVGGFAPLASSEDVALIAALTASGASIAWSAAPRVFTSARKSFTAPGGFGATLLRVERETA